MMSPNGTHGTATCPSSLNVVSYPDFLCNCGKRMQCIQCHRAWVGRRYRTNIKWLEIALESGGIAWFGLFTLPNIDGWVIASAELWSRWRKLGRARSLSKQRRRPDTLAQIRRGIAAMHFVNKSGAFQPHLHAVFVSDPEFDPLFVINLWKEFGSGYADLERANSLGATLRYSINGPMPSSKEGKLEMDKILKGKHLIKRIGS